MKIRNDTASTTVVLQYARVVVVDNIGDAKSWTKLENSINMLNGATSTTSTSYGTGGYGAVLDYDSAPYDGNLAFYLEATMYCTSTSVECELYDQTDSVQISEITWNTSTHTRVRSASSFTLTDGHKYVIRRKRTGAAGTAYVTSAKLILQQTGSPITKTRLYKATGGLGTVTSTTHALYYEYFYLDKDNLPTNQTYYYEASLYINDTYTAESDLFRAAAAVVADSEVTTTSATKVPVRSVALTMTDDTYYCARAAVDAAGGSFDRTVTFLIIDVDSGLRIVTDVVTISAEDVVVEVVGPTLKTVEDVIALVDAVLAGKGLIIADTLALADAINLTKSLTGVSDTISLADAPKVTKSLTSVADAVSVSDAFPAGCYLRTSTSFPVIAGVSNFNVALCTGNQHKLWKVNDLYWLSYFNNNTQKLVYKISRDGYFWSDHVSYTTSGGTSHGGCWDTLWDGTHIHYVSCGLYGSSTLVYRRGTPSSTGVITWDAAEQNISSGDANDEAVAPPSLAIDTDGKVWLGYNLYDDSASANYPCVTKNANSDGTWSHDDGFPYTLSTAADSTDWVAVPVALDSGKVFVFYCYTTRVYGKLYDAGWGGEETCSSHNCSAGYRMACGQQSNEPLTAFNSSPIGYIYFNRRDGGNWAGADTQLATGIQSYDQPVLGTHETEDRVYVLWDEHSLQEEHYNKCSEGSWGGDTSWFGDTCIQTTTETSNACYQYVVDNEIAYAYNCGAASPYKVKFAILTDTVLQTVTDTLALADTTSHPLRTILPGDTISLTDALKTDKQFTLSEAIALADAINTGKELKIAEAVALTDAVLKHAILPIADAVVLAEAIKIDETLSIADAIALADVVKRGGINTVAEAIALTDTLKADKGLKIAETLALADEVKRGGVNVVTETVSLADAVLLGLELKIVETLTLTDTVLKSGTLAIADTVTLADAVKRGGISLVTDAVSLADTILAGLSLKIADTILLTDAVRAGLGLKIADSVLLTDAVTRGGINIVTEAVTLADTVLASVGLKISETLTVTDVVKKHATLPLTDTITLTDAVKKYATLPITDSISLTDVVKRGGVNLVAETISLIDSILRHREELEVEDEIQLADALKITKLLTLADSIALTDLLSLTKMSVILDAISVTDTALTGKSFALTDTVSLLDTLLTLKSLTGVSDSILLTDAPLINKSPASVADTLLLTDLVLAGKGLKIAENIALTDAISIPTRVLFAIESVLLTDVVKRGGISVVIDTISLLDEVIRDVGLRTVTDELTLTDTMSLPLRVAIAVESVLLTDASKVGKELKIADVLTSIDVSLVMKSPTTVTDVIALTDVMLKHVVMPITDTISLVDAVALLAAMKVTDTVTVTDVPGLPLKTIILVEAIRLASGRILT